MKLVPLVLLLIASRATASDNTYLRSIASSAATASRIEGWRLTCRDTSGNIITRTERPIWQAADLDSSARVQLVSILEAGSRDTSVCVDYRCGYCAGYRIVIHDAVPPVRMTISEGCIGWSFKRGDKILWQEGGCSYVPPSLLPSFRAWIARIFGPDH